MVVFDIDDTISIIGERKKFLRQKPKEWDLFFHACHEDQPNWPIVNLCRLIQSSGMPVAFVTGRREDTREMTIEWLRKYDMLKPKTILLMRPINDTRHDVELKPELVMPFINSIIMVFDDRNSMVKKWRELGLTCLQVRNNDY